MAIGGIGSYGMSGYFNYQSAMSRVKLQQALSRNTRYQQSIQPVQAVDKVKDFSASSSVDFLKNYSSTMTDLMQSSNTLRTANRTGVMNDLEVTSSDTSVAEASERYPVRNTKDITVDVTQVAANQVNLSEGVKGSEAAESAMDFTITGKSGASVSVSVAQNYENGEVKSNRQMLKEAAAQINSQKDLGVRAFLEDKDGVSTLKLQSVETGEKNSFSVSGAMGAAAGMENVNEAAQDAIFTETSNGTTINRKSSSNQVTIDYARINLNLKSEGEVTVSAKPDDEKIASAVEDLTKSYNSALKLLNDNADRGNGVMNQLRNLVMGLGPEKNLEKVGITTKKDGTLELNKDVLKKSLKEDPKLTKDILGGSYSIAQTGFNKASQAANTNAASLISNDLKEMEQETYASPFNYMNMYSRTGAYSMSNYNALGLMMNYLV